MGDFLAGLTGLSAGIVSGSALCALYIALGVLIKPAMSIGVYKMSKSVVISNTAGAALLTVVTIFGLSIRANDIFMVIFSFFSGVFVGITIGCIADVVSSLSAIKNLGISKKFIVYIIISFGTGKLLGSLIYWLTDVF